jgi:hypothetical protein
VRGACLCVKKMEGVKIGGVKTGRVRIGARHVGVRLRVRPDRQRRPRTLRSVQALRPRRVLLLSVIAGMAHSTLESGAATRNGVAWGIIN